MITPDWLANYPHVQRLLDTDGASLDYHPDEAGTLPPTRPTCPWWGPLVLPTLALLVALGTLWYATHARTVARQAAAAAEASFQQTLQSLEQIQRALQRRIPMGATLPPLDPHAHWLWECRYSLTEPEAEPRCTLTPVTPQPGQKEIGQ